MNQIARELDYIAKMQDAIYTRRRTERARNITTEPFNIPPEGNAPFNPMGAVAGVGTTGTTVTILSVRVPNGWDGIIKELMTGYTGTNFTQGSGNLSFGLRINGMFVMNYENILFTIGDMQNGMKILPGIIVKSGQLIELVCTVGAGFIPQNSSQLTGGWTGYYYPNGIARTN